MDKTIIIGARADGHAKVVLHILLATKQYDVIGFIDDDVSKKGTFILGVPVLGQMKDIPSLKEKHHITCGIVAIGHNAQRRTLAEELTKHNIQLINAIHPSVIMDSDVKIGLGNYFGQGVIIVTGTQIGNCVNIHTGTTIDHDNIISDGANIGPGSHTAGRVKIGKESFLGTGCVVIPDINIGKNVTVGAGTVVIRNLVDSSKVVGNPARVIKNDKK